MSVIGQAALLSRVLHPSSSWTTTLAFYYIMSYLAVHSAVLTFLRYQARNKVPLARRPFGLLANFDEVRLGRPMGSVARLLQNKLERWETNNY